jgi:hypothetical protein
MKKTIKNIALSASFLGIFVLSGCATMFGDKTQTLNFTATKANNIILTDGKGQNKYSVPGTVTITKDTEQVRFRVDCANAFEQKIPREIQGVFWLNILSGGLIGSGIDYLTGKMWQYDTDVVVPANSCG